MTQPTIRDRVTTYLQSIPPDREVTASEVCKNIKKHGVTVKKIVAVLREEDVAEYVPHGVNADGKSWGAGKWRRRV